MAKQTVESCLFLDAHVWTGSALRAAAQRLCRAFDHVQSCLQAGKPPDPKVKQYALVPIRWTRGHEKTPAGEIRWAVQDAEGDRIRRLVLLFGIIHAEQQYNRRQEVELAWHSRAGKPLARPVLLCPFCGRRCRFLYAAPHGRQGGPSLGEFACRTCGNLCYAAQREYRSVWAKRWSAWNKGMSVMARLSAKAQHAPEQLTEADLRRAEAAAQGMKALSFDSRLNKFWNTQPVEKDTEDKEEDGENRRVWDVLPPPVFTPFKRRGRPSPRQQRQQARACAKLLREAQKEAAQQAKRKPGRPKTRRPYQTTFRVESGCAGRLAPDEGYCVACRAPHRIMEAAPFVARNGRSGIKGQCATCGRGLCRMGGQEGGEKV